jgi:glucose/arabinose dehydrogenase
MRLPLAALAGVAVGLLAPTATAQVELATETLVSGLTRPVYIGQAPGQDRYMWIVEQRVITGAGPRGQLRVFDRFTGTLLPAPALQVPVATGNEQGLLGVAFHPDFDTNGRLYINYTPPGGTFNSGITRIVEYTATGPDKITIDPASARPVLSIDQPFSNHNAGWIGFSPNDGYLYIPTGDGGSGGDPGNRAQDISNQLLGKVLRIDVGNDDFPADPDRNYAVPASNPFVGDDPVTGGDDEIWAYGLRNPFRASFDRETGDFWIGDVGQGNIEEIDFQPANSPGGENYGWRCFEGFAPFNTSNCPSFTETTAPVFQYTHFGPDQPFRCSITGGVVYRGCELFDLTGWYFFADYCSNEVWRLSIDASGDVQEVVDVTDELGFYGSNPVAFGEDNEGEIYIVSLNGTVSRIVPGPSAQPCRNNCFVPCSLAAGYAEPCDQSTFGDVAAFLAGFQTNDPISDIAEPFGQFTFGDLAAFIDAFVNGCP